MPKYQTGNQKRTLEIEKISTGLKAVLAEAEAGHVHGEEGDTATNAGGKNNDSRVSGVSRVSKVAGLAASFQGVRGVIGEVARFINDYIDMPATSALVTASWVVASHLTEAFDLFPYLTITSPEKRCGKSTLLTLLELACPRALKASSISPAVIYRLMKGEEKPTLLVDEAQFLTRKGSESTEVILEILNAGIDKTSKVMRCGGEKNDEVHEYPVYGPKVFALIGNLGAVFADRCLPIRLERKAVDSPVKHCRSREVKPIGDALRERLIEWTDANRGRVEEAYHQVGYFDINNDRMADLLLPLQAVMRVDHPEGMVELQRYAESLDARDTDEDSQSTGVRLLTACRDIFDVTKPTPDDGLFIGTYLLLSSLFEREEEPWRCFNRGREMTAEALARLLRPYGIRSGRNRKQNASGYFARDFEDAWNKYLPLRTPRKLTANPATLLDSGSKTEPNPADSANASNPSIPVNPAGSKSKKGGHK